MIISVAGKDDSRGPLGAPLPSEPSGGPLEAPSEATGGRRGASGGLRLPTPGAPKEEDAPKGAPSGLL